jgi:hypothetical protein
MNSNYYLRFEMIGFMNVWTKGALLLLSVITCSTALAQEAQKPRVSPLAVVSVRYKESYVKIVYSQPQKKGREIFGKLVPYDQVWRTGANEATEVTITKDILINKLPLKAGTYSLFAIPGKEKWKIILNNDLGMWGSYNYNPKMDALTFEVPSQTIPDNVVYEPFTILINQKTDTADVVLLWDRTQVSFPIQFIDPKP